MDRYPQKCQDIFEHSPVFMLIWRLQPQQRDIEFISKNVENILGYHPQEILSEHFSWERILHPEDSSRLKAKREDFVDTGGREWLLEYRLKTKAGPFRWFREQGFIQKPANKNDYRIQSIIFDISDYKQAYQALIESEAKFKNLAEQSPNMIFINQGGKVNEQCVKIMGYKRNEFYASDFDFFTLVSPDHHDLIRENIQKHAQGHNVPPLEYTIVTKSGQTMDVILSTRVFHYEGDWAILGTVTDITERKQAEKEIMRYQQRLRSLTSELARTEERQRRELAAQLHDGTCQELALLKMQLQSLIVDLPAHNREAFVSVCTGLTETMEKLRDLTFNLCPPELHISGLYAAVESLIDHHLREFGDIAWHFQCKDKQKKDTLSDDIRILLYMSIRELLINAVKHACADTVRVECQQNDGAFVVSVSDNGRGFDFQQTSPSQAGGFGLFNIQERLEHFGGHLSIASEPGQGSTITLTVPKA